MKQELGIDEDSKKKRKKKKAARKDTAKDLCTGASSMAPKQPSPEDEQSLSRLKKAPGTYTKF